ncbi:sigma factor [Allorhizocola rhizosphaerae]|uniref:sigma factor n=1 Tax=Allorhizocola rhizosphaerae TaxID=1872709 RepID=UPI001B8B80B2|nr:sigma factor [Allorhizocola rhizosphaerae]
MDPTLLEPATFASVYSREYAGLVRLAYLTTGSVGAAEEVVQDVFAAWYRHGAHVRDPAAYLRSLPRSVAASGPSSRCCIGRWPR